MAHFPPAPSPVLYVGVTGCVLTVVRLLPRLLLVEDDPARIARFRTWVTGKGFGLIEASSGGRALGILRPGMSAGIAGICLDHDLEKSPLTEDDKTLSGSDLLVALIRSVPRWVPILIHSMNPDRPVVMERRLRAAGFSVTRIRMAVLDQARFGLWLDEVADIWADLGSEGVR